MKLSKISLLLLAVCVLAFGTAVYPGLSNPIDTKLTPLSAQQMSSCVGALYCYKCPGEYGPECDTETEPCENAWCETIEVGEGYDCVTHDGQKKCESQGSWKSCKWGWMSTCYNDEGYCGGHWYCQCKEYVLGTCQGEFLYDAVYTPTACNQGC